MVSVRIVRDDRGVYMMCQRDKYKHWFELGKHPKTDKAFESALANGGVCWKKTISDSSKLFKI